MNQSSVVEKLRKISTDNPGQRHTRLKFLAQKKKKTSSQVPSYASPKLLPSDLLTGVKCRATSVAKNGMNMTQMQFSSSKIGSRKQSRLVLGDFYNLSLSNQTIRLWLILLEIDLRRQNSILTKALIAPFSDNQPKIPLFSESQCHLRSNVSWPLKLQKPFIHQNENEQNQGQEKAKPQYFLGQ